ncbi:MAG: glycine cleavage T C-terminal barrel domain-containing protein [Gemmatimonadales bacterium]|jgi:folate-binding protein YgfZ
MDDLVARLFDSPIDLGDWKVEYRFLVEQCALALRSDRRIVRLGGPRHAEMLDGLVTNRIKDLEAEGRHAMLLTPKGRVVTDLRAFPFGEGMLVDVPQEGLANLKAAFQKYLPPVHATHEDASDSLSLVGVYGPGGPEAVAGVLPAVPRRHLESVEIEFEGAGGLLVRNRRLAGDGVEIFVAREVAVALIERLLSALRGRAGGLAGSRALDVVRVECGIPRYGVDITEANLAQETGLEAEAISYDKGCYLGQEVVARVHFRGHVNRRLTGLKFAGDLAETGAGLRTDAGKDVGRVTSVVESPEYGPIGLGYVRREVAEGARLRWTGGAGEGEGTVTPLPFRGSTV